MSKSNEVKDFFNRFNKLTDEEQQQFRAVHEERMRRKREEEASSFSFTDLTNDELAKHPDFRRFWQDRLGKDLSELTKRQAGKNREAFMQWVEEQEKEEE